MSANIDGFLTPQYRGILYVPLVPTSYVVPNIYTITCQRSGSDVISPFGGGDVWPILYSINQTFSSGAPGKIIKYNAAFCGPLARTLLTCGDQSAGLQIAESSVPVYHKGQLVNLLWNQFTNASLGVISISSIGLTIGANNITFPALLSQLLGTSMSNVSQFSGAIQFPTSVIGYNGGQALCAFFAITGFNDYFFFIWPDTGGPFITKYNPTGYPTTTTRTNIMGISGKTQNTMLLCCVGNLPGYAYNPDLIAYFSAVDMSLLATYEISYDDQTINNAFHNVTGRHCTFTAAGYVTKSKVPYLNQNATYVLLSADGLSYSPIIFTNPTNDATLAAALKGDLFTTFDIKIDPTGTVFAAYNPTGLQANNTTIFTSFNLNIGSIQIPPCMTINLPAFTMPCYTPCDPPVIIN